MGDAILYEGFFGLLFGVGLFLYSINIMSEKTQEAFGDSLKSFLGKTARGRWSSILTGTAVTAAVQSSTAVTVMLVSLAESGIVSLFQAVGIIMGANMGTTVTSLLIAVDFSALAPFFIVFGAFLKLLCGKERVRAVGEVILAFGMLFAGLKAMSGAFSSLKDNPVFLNMIVSASGKVGGILSGILMTVIIQSSSATVGILQGLAAEGLVSLGDAVYIVLGQNIGTVLTAILASVGRSAKAGQIGKIHLIFNIAGCLFFLPLCALLPVGEWLGKIGNPSLAVSVFHIIFNIVNTVILLPFYDRFVRLGEERASAQKRKPLQVGSYNGY